MSRRRSLQLSAFAPAAIVALATACVESPRHPVKPPPAETTPPPAPMLPPLAARWVESGRSTLIGPAVPSGTLVLLGGRRAILHADGSLENEKAPAPEPLAELLEVPSASGARLVGRSVRAVYRFDDPLAAPVVLARSEFPLDHLGAGPGVIAVWAGASERPRFLDVETGAERPLPGLPEPPLRALVFVDAKRGAGIFEASGLALTSDGGATWRLAADASPGDASRVNGLRRRRGEVRAFAYADGPDGAIDLDAARLGRLEPDRRALEAPLARWIQATHRDPLEAVAAAGLDLPDGRALVASHGLVAKVHPRTGAVEAMVDIARGKGVGPCGAGRAGSTAWAACSLAEGSAELFDPFGVVRVPLGDGPLAVEAPAVVRNGEAELRVSPSGGAMLLSPCKNEESGSVCVRQPDGKWRTFSIDADLSERGAGPLADGRVAFLRGMYDGDVASAGKTPGAGGHVDEEGAAERRLHVAIAGPDGKEQHLAPIGFSVSRGYVRVQSPIEEDLDHTLRFVVEDGEGPCAVVAPPGKDGAQARRVADTVVARLHAGRGVAVGEGHVLASLDGGVTWNEIPTTLPVLEAARMVAASYEDGEQLAVSEVGLKVGPMLRLGWGPSDQTGDAPEAAPTPGPAPTRIANRPAAQGAGQVLACTSQGPAGSTPPLDSTTQARQLLAGKPVRTPGTRVESAVWSSSRAGVLDTVAMLDEEGPEGRTSTPAKWTVRWHDPQEISGKVRTASVPVPKGSSWGTSLRLAASSGGRAMFLLRSVGKVRLLRVKPAGGVEVIDVPAELAPSGEVVFGEGRSEVIAWARDNDVIAWSPGERPRVIAHLGPHATRVLGAPTPAGVPLLLSGPDWAMERTLPVTGDPLPVRLPLDGWTHLAAVPRRPDGLPVCASRPAPNSARFTLSRLALRAEIDGVSESGAQAMFEVRVHGSEICLAGVTATISPDQRSTPPAGAAFVRVDLAGKRAEGGDRGLAPAAAVRRMTCSLVAKP